MAGDLLVLRWCLTGALAVFALAVHGFLRVKASDAGLSSAELVEKQRQAEETRQEKQFRKDAKRESDYLAKRIPDELATQNRLEHQYARQTGTAGKRKVRRLELPDRLIRETEVVFPLNSRAFPRGMSFRHLLDPNLHAMDNLQHGINRTCRTEIDDYTQQVFLCVSWRNSVGGLPIITHWGKVVAQLLNSSRYSVVLGKDKAGRIVTMDLTRWPHALIMGATGMGKSVFVRQALCTLLQRNHPSDLEFILIDLKGLDFGAFRRVPHVIEYVTNPDKAIKALEKAADELDRRQALLKDKAQDISEWNRKHEKRRLPRLFVWCDELAALTRGGDAGRRKSAIQLILKLVTLGRALGINVLISTQTVSKDVLPMDITANVDGRLCFGLRNQSASILAVGDSSAYGLRPPGRAVTERGSELIQVQAPMITQSEVNETIQMTLRGEVWQQPPESKEADQLAPVVKWTRPSDAYEYAHSLAPGDSFPLPIARIAKDNRRRVSRSQLRKWIYHNDNRYFSANGWHLYQEPSRTLRGRGRIARMAHKIKPLADQPGRLISATSGDNGKGDNAG